MLPFIDEPSLWPVLFVFMGHGMAFGAAALLLGLRDRNPVAGLALLLMVFWSVGAVRYDLQRERARGAISVVLALTWALAIGGAWIADKYSIF